MVFNLKNYMYIKLSFWAEAVWTTMVKKSWNLMCFELNLLIPQSKCNRFLCSMQTSNRKKSYKFCTHCDASIVPNGSFLIGLIIWKGWYKVCLLCKRQSSLGAMVSFIGYIWAESSIVAKRRSIKVSVF